MPSTRVMFVAVAAFPAAVSPGDLPAAERAGLPAGRCGDLAVCHLRDPPRCRLTVHGLRWTPRPPWWRRPPAADAATVAAYACGDADVDMKGLVIAEDRRVRVWPATMVEKRRRWRARRRPVSALRMRCQRGSTPAAARGRP